MTVRYDIIYRKLFMSLLIDRTTKMVNINAKCIVRWVKVAVLYSSKCVSLTLTKRAGDKSGRIKGVSITCSTVNDNKIHFSGFN